MVTEYCGKQSENYEKICSSLVHGSQRIFDTGCKKENDAPGMGAYRNLSHLLMKITYAQSQS